MLPSFLPWVQTLAGAFPQVCSLCLAHVDVTQAEVGRGREHQLLCDGEAPDPFMPPGSYFYTLDWHEAQEGRFLLQLPNVQPSSSGIYSATYLEASPLGSAFFRLIVRGQEQRAEVVGGVGGWEPCGTSCGPPASSGPPGLPQSSAAVVQWVRVSC